jgi:muramoyltetrapeptide carboxypeptidase
MRFAGDDATRVAAIHRAAASGADVALISRGGYGLTRLLPDIRYKALAKAVERGTRFMGLQRLHGAADGAVCQNRRHHLDRAGGGHEDFGAETPDDIMQACFDDLLCGQGEGAGWQLPTGDAVAIKTVAGPQGGTGAEAGFSLKPGVLWGGNLAVLGSLIGTPWLPEVRGGVLFLEDVNEHPFRVERLLTQLLRTGILDRQKALVLGQFSNYRLVPHDRGFKLATVVDWLRTQTRVPVLTGLPFGHVPTKVVLPVGAKVRLEVEGRDAFLLWVHAH